MVMFNGMTDKQRQMIIAGLQVLFNVLVTDDGKKAITKIIDRHLDEGVLPEVLTDCICAACDWFTDVLKNEQDYIIKGNGYDRFHPSIN